jgi:hypothetical protein
MEKKELNEDKVSKQKKVPKYEPPKIISYTSKEIIEQIGPAQACSPAPPCPISV